MPARRTFLHSVAGAIAASAAPAAANTTLPAVKLGGHQVTRLIAGYNPIGGYSHSVPKLSAIMRNWFTTERIVEFLASCERHGINTWQASIDPRAFQALRAARDRGSNIQWLCLMDDATPEQWKEVVALKPLAVVHHGEVTDRLYRANQQSKIAGFIRKAHDFGLLAGISSHSPDNIARSEAANWEQDLYMTCFYNIRRDIEKVRAGLGDIPVDELYLERDPERMTAVVRQVSRPCLAFKILAAGRLANNGRGIEKAFAYTYANIKPSDAAIVGMFPILTDEVAENAAIARRVLSAT